MNRSIIMVLLLLCPLSIMLQEQTGVLAALISTTRTQTVTSYLTLTGTGQTTFTQLSSVQTVTGTTYTTTGVTMVLAQVLTTAAYPVVMTAVTGGTSCNAANQCIGWAKMISVTYIVPKTGYVMGYAPSTVQGTVTSQYVTSVLTTLFSTSAYATGQVVSVTETQTLTSVSEQAGLSISDILSQNLLIVLLVAVVLGVLGFRLMRRGGTGKSGVSLPSAPAQPAQGPKSGIVYCRSCGTQNPAINEFCGKCGTKL